MMGVRVRVNLEDGNILLVEFKDGVSKEQAIKTVKRLDSQAHKLPVAVVGVTGYVARELLRKLANHPYTRVDQVVSSSRPGVRVSEIWPEFRGIYDHLVTVAELDKSRPTACVILATPAEASLKLVPELLV